MAEAARPQWPPSRSAGTQGTNAFLRAVKAPRPLLLGPAPAEDPEEAAWGWASIGAPPDPSQTRRLTPPPTLGSPVSSAGSHARGKCQVEARARATAAGEEWEEARAPECQGGKSGGSHWETGSAQGAGGMPQSWQGTPQYRRPPSERAAGNPAERGGTFSAASSSGLSTPVGGRESSKYSRRGAKEWDEGLGTQGPYRARGGPVPSRASGGGPLVTPRHATGAGAGPGCLFAADILETESQMTLLGCKGTPREGRGSANRELEPGPGMSSGTHLQGQPILPTQGVQPCKAQGWDGSRGKLPGKNTAEDGVPAVEDEPLRAERSCAEELPAARGSRLSAQGGMGAMHALPQGPRPTIPGEPSSAPRGQPSTSRNRGKETTMANPVNGSLHVPRAGSGDINQGWDDLPSGLGCPASPFPVWRGTEEEKAAPGQTGRRPAVPGRAWEDLVVSLGPLQGPGASPRLAPRGPLQPASPKCQFLAEHTVPERDALPTPAGPWGGRPASALPSNGRRGWYHPLPLPLPQEAQAVGCARVGLVPRSASCTENAFDAMGIREQDWGLVRAKGAVQPPAMLGSWARRHGTCNKQGSTREGPWGSIEAQNHPDNRARTGHEQPASPLTSPFEEGSRRSSIQGNSSEQASKGQGTPGACASSLLEEPKACTTALNNLPVSSQARTSVEDGNCSRGRGEASRGMLYGNAGSILAPDFAGTEEAATKRLESNLQDCGEAPSPAQAVGVTSPVETTANSSSMVSIPSSRSFQERYELGELLGKGAYGLVWACRERATRKVFACKVLEKPLKNVPEFLKAINNEVSVMEQLQGERTGVVQLQEALQTSRTVYVVMEMCRGGSLFDLLSISGRIPERSAREVFKQVVTAVAHCHSRNIVHRDIKPENVLLNQPALSLYSPNSLNHSSAPVQAKLADFGLAVRVQPGTTIKGLSGTKSYIAPEVLRGERYGPAVDVWSLGALLYGMLMGRTPFSTRTRNDEEAIREIASALTHGRLGRGSSTWAGLSEQARDLITSLLQVEPASRPSAREVLKHPWLQEQDGALPVKVGPQKSTSLPVVENKKEHKLPERTPPNSGNNPRKDQAAKPRGMLDRGRELPQSTPRQSQLEQTALRDPASIAKERMRIQAFGRYGFKAPMPEARPSQEPRSSRGNSREHNDDCSSTIPKRIARLVTSDHARGL